MAFKRTRYSVDDLLDQARNRTRRLSPGERKQVIQHLDETERRPKSLKELSDLLGVSRMQASRDRIDLIKRDGEALSAVNATQVVAEYLKDLDKQIEGIQALLSDVSDTAAVVPGSLPHVSYEKLLADLRERRIAKLQEIGVVPKELGRLNVREEVWKAVVDQQSGIITTSSLEPGAAAEHLE